MEPKPSEIKYSGFQPFVMIPFWHNLSKKKLDEYKLSDAERDILAGYKVNNFKDNKSVLNFDTFSFSEDITNNGQVEVRAFGKLKNFNTKENFTPEAVSQLTKEVGLKFYEDYLKKIAE